MRCLKVLREAVQSFFSEIPNQQKQVFLKVLKCSLKGKYVLVTYYLPGVTVLSPHGSEETAALEGQSRPQSHNASGRAGPGPRALQRHPVLFTSL